MKNTRPEALACVSRERDYQEKKWPNNPLSPSDALRVVRCLIEQADAKWYTTPDHLVDGVKVNDVDLHALRKIAATAVHALERWGALDRPLSEIMAIMTPEELKEWSDGVELSRQANEKLLADNPEILADPTDPEGPDGRVNAK